MQRNKHKRKTNHVVIVTNDAATDSDKQFYIKESTRKVLKIVLLVVAGLALGYFIFEATIWRKVQNDYKKWSNTVNEMNDQISALKTQIEDKEGEINSLTAEIADLEDQNKLLSDALNEKVQREEELVAQLDGMKVPSEFPLSGSASIKETELPEPGCVFEVSKGTNIIASANGTVSAVNEDLDYGYNVWLDHGNGYISIYRSKGKPNVEEGDTVVRGTTLFNSTKDDFILVYQIMLNGEYIDPVEILHING